MKRLLAVTAVVVTLSIGSAVEAATISFDPILATWGVPTGGTNINFSGQGTGSASVNWGDPTTATGQSGYDFVAAVVPLMVGPVPPDQLFTLGTFTHNNHPIAAGTSITAVDLTIDTEVYVDGATQGMKSFLFTFSHHETTNNLNPCDYGGPNGLGVNVNGCADRVLVASSATSDFFIVDGVQYTLTITGFQVMGLDTSQFLSPEDEFSSALLRGSITATPTQDVPEPTSLVLLGLGLLCAGFARRRRG